VLVVVDLSVTPARVWLDEPQDCSRFHVAVRGDGDDASFDRALADSRAGRMTGDDALITVAAVRDLAAGTVDDRWEGDFSAMLDYARGRGWVTEDGEAIRAHVEWR
jgi:hypothetical protein